MIRSWQLKGDFVDVDVDVDVGEEVDKSLAFLNH